MTALEVINFSKSFGGVHAVAKCSFKIAPAKITALIGPNGAGKTTLFNLVNGFIMADQGRVIFGKSDITKMTVWQRSRLGLSRTFQQSRFFKNLSLQENLLLALRQDDDRFWRMFFKNRNQEDFYRKIDDVLKLVELNKDLETPVTALSYGELKLLDLARAILNPHSLLLLDEPVAGVAKILREKLKRILKHLKEQRETILLIEHDIDFVKSVADWVIVMDQGTVLMEGEVQKIMKDKRVLEAYLGREY